MAFATPTFDFSLDKIYQQLTGLNVCKALSLLLGLHMVQVGLWVFWDARNCVKAFGLRYDGKTFYSSQGTSDNLKKRGQNSTAEAEESGNFWPLLFAPREVGFGLLVLVFAGLGEWRAVGVTVVVVAGLLATTDGVASGLYGKDGWPGAIKGHGIPAVLIGAVAAGLLIL